MSRSHSSNIAHTAHIPPELVEYIVGFISHRSTLKKCSLAGPAFTLAAQKGLFWEVVLSPPKPCGRKFTPAGRFLNLLNSSSHLAPFVHSLAVESEGSVEQQPWLYTDDDLQHIFPALRNLSKISIKGRSQSDNRGGFGKANLSWNSLSSSLRRALASAIHSGPVIDLELGGFSHIPASSVIGACSRLKKLSLLSLYLVDDSHLLQEESTPSEPRVHPEDIKIKQSSVALRRTADWLLKPLCHLDIAEVKRFHFEVSTLDDHQYVSRIVDACSKTLKCLELSPGLEVNSTRSLLRSVPIERCAPAFSLESLRALKSLKINSSILMFKLNNARYSDPLPWIALLLSTLPDDNGLSELDLCFALKLTQEVLQQVSWANLSTIMLSKKFAGLDRITFTFPALDEGEVDERLWVRDTLIQDSYLSPLFNRGLLRLSV